MAYTKRTWLGRQGTGLNKFSIGGATPVTIVNQPDSVTQVGDALSAGNLNDLEDRIEDAFDDVDTELDTKADEQDVTNLNNAIDNLDHRVQNIEQAKGDYIVSAYKDGSTTPSGKGKWCVVEGVEGVSRVENNAVKNGDFSDGTTNWQTSVATLTASDGVATFTVNAQNGQMENTNAITLDNTHFYLYSLKVKGASSNSGLNAIISGAGAGSVALNSMSVTTSWQTFAGVFKPQNNSTTAKVTIYDGRSSGWDAYQLTDIAFVDLSVYFGTTDLSFLGATNDAKLATIQRDYPHLLLPSDYGTRIVDWTGNGVRAWARNLWNESHVYGSINESTGQDYENGNTAYWRSEGYIPINPNTTYYQNTDGYVGNFRHFFYDANKNYIGFTVPTATSQHGGYGVEFTSPSGAFYMRFRFSTPLTNYKNCISVSDSLNGTYTPYHAPSTLSFPSTTLKSAGSVRDTLELNVEVNGMAKKRETERIESYTFDGTENWSKSGDYYRLSKFDSTILQPQNDTTVPAVILEGYIATMWQTTADKAVYIGPSNVLQNSKLWVRDTAGGTEAQFAQSMIGRTIHYAVINPTDTLSDPILDNTLLTEAYGRMSTVQTGTVVDGIADLGFITL